MGIYFTPKQDTIMKKLCFILLLYAFCLLPLAAQHPPKHEVRAAWITAVYGLDWPRTRATTPESIRKQQAELVEILDKLKAAIRYFSKPVLVATYYTNQQSNPIIPS